MKGNNCCNSFFAWAMGAAVMVLCWCVAPALTSCGEDRTHELADKTQHNRWILERMRDRYLWADTLQSFEPDWKSFFATPADFLKKLTDKTRQNDKWSYVTVDTIAQDVHANGHFNHINSYGFDFVLMSDPTGKTTKTYARVLTVYPNSPAAEGGLRRDDFIGAFDGYNISQKNAGRLEKGLGVRLTVSNLAIDGEEFVLIDKRDLQIGASRRVEDVAFPVSGTFSEAGIAVGYLMCTRLVEGDSDGNEYRDALDGIMARFRQQQVSELVLDLRLCNCGSLDMACRLASYVVSPLHVNSVFAKTFHNAAYASSNKSVAYDSTVGNLCLGRVFVLTSERTRGAAEWLIRNLKHTMGDENVVVVGKATAGQNVMTESIGNEYHVNLFPAVAYVADADGNYNYGNIAPDETVDETSYVFLSQYGHPTEPLLNKALELMLY